MKYHAPFCRRWRDLHTGEWWHTAKCETPKDNFEYASHHAVAQDLRMGVDPSIDAVTRYSKEMAALVFSV